MTSFIDLCVTDILQKHRENLLNTTVVFPSKRAMVFFKRSMQTHISQMVFLPKLSTIQEFCLEKQNATIPDDFTLVHLLYQSYRTFAKTTETLEDFYPWGEMLLSDFDDIDKYKINAKDLFTNIADIKDIESLFDYLNEEQKKIISDFWDTTKIPTKSSENDVRKNFLNLWKLLPSIYTDFTQKLQEQHLCYEGMAIRSVAELPVEEKAELFGNKTYLFIGFNALSECEKSLFSFLQNRKQAFFYWDYDTYYKQDQSHEAGIFIRKNLQEFKNELDESNFSNFLHDKTIQLVKAPNELAQAKYCSEVLKNATVEDTAIVLADEKLIVPILNSIPPDIKYNITLGYPIRSSAAYTLFESILDLYVNVSSNAFYYKDVLRICENSLFSLENQKNAISLRSKIVKEKKITIPQKECVEVSKFDYIFKADVQTDTYVNSLKETIIEFSTQNALDDIDKSIFYTIYTELAALQTVIDGQHIHFERISFINNLLKKSLQNKTIAIAGEPLEGLQVMGILEARMLDFKNLILTSVTDENLPKTSTGGSFIPYNLRVAFGMPTIKEQSAMYSYYFYRLLQRSENITLLYSESSGENKAEKSRFILQLLYESPFKNLSDGKNNPNKKFSGIQETEYYYTISPNNAIEYSSAHTGNEIETFVRDIKSTRKLSPTALIKFIQCERQFYFSAIKGLRKPQDFEELPQAVDIGNYFHTAMETIYKPYINKEVTPAIIDAILKDQDALKQVLTDAMKQNNAPQNVRDQNSKEFLTLLKRINNFLEAEKQKPFTIVALESDEAQLLLPNGINIGGRIDRLDFCQGVYRIVDYKTGNCNEEKLRKKISIQDIETLFTKNKTYPKEAFQALFYAYIFKKLHSENSYQPNLFFIQLFGNDANKTTLDIGGEELITFDGELLTQFEEKLLQLTNAMISAEQEFELTTIADTCTYCDFKAFCNKETNEASF